MNVKINMKITYILLLSICIWGFILNGIPYFAYKSNIQFDKTNNIVTQQFFPTGKTIKIVKYSEIQDIKNSFNFISVFTPKFGSQKISDSATHKLSIITYNKNFNLYPMMKGYEIDSKINQIKRFKNNSEADKLTITLENYSNILGCFILLAILILALTSEFKNKK